MKGEVISIETYQKFHVEHEAGTSLKDIARKHNFKYTTLYYGFKRLGLTVHIATNEQRKRNRVQEDWFENIDTQLKAYYLGLLMSDGYVNHRELGNKSARICLKLHESDKYLVQEFVNQVQPGASLYKDKASYACQVPSNKMASDLHKHGLVPRKTEHGECFPVHLSEEYMFHFIRGYFDGDGSISLGARNRSTIYICCSNLTFLEVMKDYLYSKHAINTSIYTENRNNLGYKSMFTLHIKHRQKFYKKLYKDASIFMIRKKLKYDHVNTVLTDKNNRQRRA